jgi:hypothetical protein
MYQPSGGSESDNGAPYDVFQAFKIKELDSKNSVEPTAGSRGDLDTPLGQPLDKEVYDSVIRGLHF